MILKFFCHDKNIITFIFSMLYLTSFSQWSVIAQDYPNSILSSICFPDDSIGYAAGRVLSEGILLKTTDGGESWTSLNCNTAKPLNSLFFWDANTGYVVAADPNGTQILKTHDGGSTWNSVYSNNGGGWYLSIHFADVNTGYVVGDFPEGSARIILKTTDGGASWNSISYPANWGLTSCFFHDSLTGYAVGEHGTILKTENGGNSWTYTEQGFFNLHEVFFTSLTTGYIVGSGGTILKTNNSGDTWTVLHSSGPDLYSVFFTSDSRGYSTGENGTILMTNDGGSSWDQSDTGTDKHLRSVFFTNSNTGYAAGDSGVIIKTTNGGALHINENKFSASHFKVYPNPVVNSQTIKVNIPFPVTTNISIFSINSELLFNKTYQYQNLIELNVKFLPKGIYLLKIQTQNIIEVKKIVIQ
ncbi:MAG: T9SS type A sorting domain-containing protein [Bacteroidales bacterium]|nr:T9SS type A sorting domain-containing protein [Bacteroidales bacterium]